MAEDSVEPGGLNVGTAGREVLIRPSIWNAIPYFVPLAIFPFVIMAASCLLYTSPSPRDRTRSRMPSSA